MRLPAFVLNHKACLLVIALVAIALGGVSREHPSDAPPDPVFQGTPLSVWLEKLNAGNGSFQISPGDLHTIGAVTWLAWAAEHGRIPSAPVSRSLCMQKVHEWLHETFHRSSPEDYDERSLALDVLGYMGADAAPAIPVLTRVLAGSDVHRVRTAASGLVWIGPPGWPAVEQSFHDDGPKARIALVSHLEVYLHGRAKSMASSEADRIGHFLVNAMDDPDARVRIIAARVLAAAKNLSTHPDSEFAICILTSYLSDPAPELRRLAASAITNYGPAAAPAIPDLIRLLDDPEPPVRASAAEALGRIDTINKCSEARLRQLTHDKNGSAGYAATRALKDLGLDPKK